MMVRHYEIDFNSGALVFPGGSVDKGDREIIANADLFTGGEGLDADALSFRIAAIRETFEESGILLARREGVDGADRCATRQRDRSRPSQGSLRRQRLVPEGARRQRTGRWRSTNSFPMRTGSRRRACRSASTPGSSSPRRRRTSSAPMTAGNPPTRSGCRRARRSRAARAGASSCRSRPRAT